MRAASQLGEAAVRRPAGPSNPDCHAGISFTALRDASAFPVGSAARRYFVERLEELSQAVALLSVQGERERTAVAILARLATRATSRSVTAPMRASASDLYEPKHEANVTEIQIEHEQQDGRRAFKRDASFGDVVG